RRNASHSSLDTPPDKAPASDPAPAPAPASATACRAGRQQAPQAHPPRSGPGTAGTGAPTLPATPQPPSSTVPPPPSGSTRHETSASCGPVATSPGSSIRPLAGAKNRTTRVLPNPDNSCAYDTAVLRCLQPCGHKAIRPRVKDVGVWLSLVEHLVRDEG